MKTKPLGRPITGNVKAEKRRKYFADRYQRLKTSGKWNEHKNTRAALKRKPTVKTAESRLLAMAEHMSHRPYHPSSVSWLDLSAGRSNS